jgi:hypothetical protein
MVRRAKLPRDGSNQIDRRYVPYGNRALAGWPDGIKYTPRVKKKRKKPSKATTTNIETVSHLPRKFVIGTPL